MNGQERSSDGVVSINCWPPQALRELASDGESIELIYDRLSIN